MWLRILKILSVARIHGHESIVLGAWGCGAFGNDPLQIAKLFRRGLEKHFAGVYGSVLSLRSSTGRRSNGSSVPSKTFFPKTSDPTRLEMMQREGLVDSGKN